MTFVANCLVWFGFLFHGDVSLHDDISKVKMLLSFTYLLYL